MSKAEEIVKKYSPGFRPNEELIADIEQFASEVREQTIRECAKIASTEEVPKLGEMPNGANIYSREQIAIGSICATKINIEKRIFSLLNSKEKSK